MTVEEGWLPPLTSDQHMQPVRHSIHHCSTHCTARPLYPIWEICVGAPVWQCQLDLAPVGRLDLAPVALGGRVFRAWESR